MEVAAAHWKRTASASSRQASNTTRVVRRALGVEESPEVILNRIGQTLRKAEELLTQVTFWSEAKGAQEKALRNIDKLLKETGAKQESAIADMEKLIKMGGG